MTDATPTRTLITKHEWAIAKDIAERSHGEEEWDACASRIAHALHAHAAQAVESCVKAVEAEEELDGPMPDDIWRMLAARDNATEVLRANVRATKRSIVKRIRAGQPGHDAA